MLKQCLKFSVLEITALNKITFLLIHKVPWNVIVFNLHNIQNNDRANRNW